VLRSEMAERGSVVAAGRCAMPVDARPLSKASSVPWPASHIQSAPAAGLSQRISETPCAKRHLRRRENESMPEKGGRVQKGQKGRTERLEGSQAPTERTCTIWS
jgi:hypothetical protein